MKTRAVRALAVIGLGAPCGGCAASRPPAEDPVQTFVVEEARAVPPTHVTDARIVRVMIRELDREPVLARERIRVRVDLGVAMLQGRVADRLAKDRAVEIAGMVKGVRAIIDQIVVAPEPRSDGEIEFDVSRVLSNDPVTSRQPIAARAHENVVHLSGDVDSIGTRRIAERDVLAIPGVVDVSDDLAVRPQRRSDRWMIAAVARIVRDDPWLDGSGVEVTAHGGVAELRGWVGSDAERVRAEYDARAASPASVDVTALRVDPVFNDDGTVRATCGWASTDGDIATALREAYMIDPRVSPFVPTVEVRDHVVVLTGVAPTGSALRAAEEDARHVPGVTDVRGDLKERPLLVEENDGSLRSDVEAMIARDPGLGTLHIAVQVQRGRVVLRGTVPSATDRMRAIALSASAPGALDVIDGLAVAPPDLARTHQRP